MAHLACKTHKRRVLVIPETRTALHRSDGTKCTGFPLVIGGKETSTELISDVYAARIVNNSALEEVET